MSLSVELKVNAVELFNGQTYEALPSDNVMTKFQISNAISTNTHNIVMNSPEDVDTMIEVSTFFSKTDSTEWSTITNLYNLGDDQQSNAMSTVSSTIFSHETVNTNKFTSLSQNVSSEFSRSVWVNDYHSNKISTAVSWVDINNSTDMSTALKNRSIEISTLTSASEAVFDTRNDNLSVAISQQLSTYLELSKVSDTNYVTTSKHLSTEFSTNTHHYSEVSKDLSTTLSFELKNDLDVSNAISVEHSRTSAEVKTVSDALNTELTNRDSMSQNLSTSIVTLQNDFDASATHYYDNVYKPHSEELSTNYANQSNALSADRIVLASESTDESIELSQLVSTNNVRSQAISTALSGDNQINDISAELKVNTAGDVMHGNIKADEGLHLGAYWRIVPAGDGLEIQYYRRSNGTWVTTLPLFGN